MKQLWHRYWYKWHGFMVKNHPSFKATLHSSIRMNYHSLKLGDTE